MKSRWLAKIAAIVCAICLAMGVMSQTVFARDNASAAGKYAPEEPMATFIVLGAEEQSATPVPEITDNRTVLPMYADGVQVGQCAIVNGQPYMGVAAFCQALGLGAQTQRLTERRHAHIGLAVDDGALAHLHAVGVHGQHGAVVRDLRDGRGALLLRPQHDEGGHRFLRRVFARGRCIVSCKNRLAHHTHGKADRADDRRYFRQPPTFHSDCLPFA